MSLADYQLLVDRLVRAPAEGPITPEDRDQAIELARLRYSSDAERKLTQDVTWLEDGHLGPLPEGWVDGCYLVSGEHPIGLQPPVLIDVGIYLTATEAMLVTADTMQAGDVVRIQFAAPHLLNAGDTPADTIPARHREAVASYAAQILLKQLATHFSAERDTSIGADRSDTESRARNYAFRAKEARATYYAGIGKADPQADKAGGQVSTGDAAAAVTSWAGRSRNSLTRRSYE